jgi:hypothetical protein
MAGAADAAGATDAADGAAEVPRYSKEEIGEKLNELDKELKMSKKEKDRLAECFKDKEFMGMFHEYMEEISDPKNRQEYNDYIRQCEAGGDTANKIPEGMQLILPKVGFCLKATSKKNGKVFVNITHTEKLREFSVARVPGQGENWSMPYCLDNPKPDKDNDGNQVAVYTIAFNTAGYMDFTREAKRREFLIGVALENIEGSFLLGAKDEFEKSGAADALCGYTYKEMKNLKFKGIDGKPTVLSCKKEDMNMKEATPEGTFGHEGVKPAKPPTKGPAKKQKGKKKKNKGKKGDPSPLKGFLDKPKKNKNGLIQELDSEEENDEEEEEEEDEPETGMCKPKYSVVHRGHFDMQDNMMGESAHGAQVDSCRPRELIVKVQLPRIDSARDVDLDVSSERLVLQVEGKYDLLLDLPFPVDEENGSAKFDKTLHMMVVTLPVVREETPVQAAREVPEEAPEEDALPAELATLLDDGGGVLVEVGGADGGAGFTCSDDLVVDGIAPDGASDRAGVTVGMTLVAFEAGSHSWNVWQQAGGTMTWDEMYGIVANAARPWRFTFAPAEADPAAEAEAAAAAADTLGVDAGDMVAGFYASPTFSGRKERYYFGTGEQGVGYYRDIGHLRGAGGGGGASSSAAASGGATGTAPPPLDPVVAAPEPEQDASSPVGGLGGFENSIMLELD